MFVFVTEAEFVYELSLYTIQVSFILQRDLIKLHTSKYETPLDFIKQRKDWCIECELNTILTECNSALTLPKINREVVKKLPSLLPFMSL